MLISFSFVVRKNFGGEWGCKRARVGIKKSKAHFRACLDFIFCRWDSLCRKWKFPSGTWALAGFWQIIAAEDLGQYQPESLVLLVQWSQISYIACCGKENWPTRFLARIAWKYKYIKWFCRRGKSCYFNVLNVFVKLLYHIDKLQLVLKNQIL